MAKKITTKEIFKKIPHKFSALFGNFTPAISNLDFKRIVELEFKYANPEIYDELMKNAEYIMNESYQQYQLKHLQEGLPLSRIEEADYTKGRIESYKSYSHHVWVTNPSKPRDMVMYKAKLKAQNANLADDVEELMPLYSKNKIEVEIDDMDNSFIQSIRNLENGAKTSHLPLSEGEFKHILWTNLSLQDIENNPKLSSFRKICSKEQQNIPEFIVLNINDVMNNVDAVKDLAHPDVSLPDALKQALPQMKEDLLSVREVFENMIHKNLFASISDVIRVAAVKNIGGMYFDLDCILYDQDLVHKNQHKYNLFDLLKNYECIMQKDGYGYYQFENGFFSASDADSKIMQEVWNIIYRNVTIPNDVPYLKYSKNGFTKVICQTGPAATALGFLKQYSDKDLVLFPGRMLYMYKPLENDVGLLGYDVCGGTWVKDANQSVDYVMYDEHGSGVTYEQYLEML